jgi:hypothetical protein
MCANVWWLAINTSVVDVSAWMGSPIYDHGAQRAPQEPHR